MQAVQISRTGGTEVLEVVDLPMPPLAPGCVLVRAEAIGVNRFDLLIRTGRYRWMPKLPHVLGNELAGRVVEVAPGVRTLVRGQKVFVAGYDIGNRGGLYAEYTTVPEDAAWPLPEAVDPAAATALTNYQLAVILLHHAARGIEPHTVVVLGAAGGVGSALIDVTRCAGAAVIAVAGSAEKCAFALARGAAHAVDSSTEQIAARVEAITHGRGADIVFDHVGGDGLADALGMLAPLGMIVSYGLLRGLPEKDVFKSMRGNIERSPAVRCFTMHTYDHLGEPRRAAMRQAIDLLGSGAVRPAIAARLPLAQAAAAHALLESRRAIGKVVLEP
jgi:NADPH2:quinone reductase